MFYKRFFRLTIANRLRIFISLGMIALTLASVFIAYEKGRRLLFESSFEHLVSLREAKSQEIKHYFEYLMDNILILARSKEVRGALKGFSQAFYEVSEVIRPDEARQRLKSHYKRSFLPRINTEVPGAAPLRGVEELLPRAPEALVLQYLYIHEDLNPRAEGEKHRLGSVSLDTPYNRLHVRYHPWFEEVVKGLELYDLFLIDSRGNVVYTVFKKKDFATNLLNGPYAGSALAQAYKRALRSPAGVVVVEDFAPYTPSYNLPAAFMATPILE
ncbi:hypothetical protein [Thermosulfuriphilus sp.]